jgi:hypothetical protein
MPRMRTCWISALRLSLGGECAGLIAKPAAAPKRIERVVSGNFLANVIGSGVGRCEAGYHQ